MPKLLLKLNAAIVKEIAMSKTSVSVGRKPDNDVVIDSPAISGHHCRIGLEGGTYYIEDLDSTNGTFVNDKRVKKVGLRHNDIVGLAKHALVFLDEVAADDTRPATKQAESTTKIGVLRVLKGVVGQSEYELKSPSTYIGKSDRAQVPIKGSGLFGSAPDVAASVHRKPEGYVLMAIEVGYPIVNGAVVAGSVVLKDGDLIDCGGTTMQFITKD
jgi:pSer/pThr/pTyr-binding forkhead associated (FHA) protein